MSAPSASWGEDEWDEASDADRRQALAAVLRDRDRLADEVRALRAELERHAAEAHRYAGLASRLNDDLDEARAALAARTPQPAEPWPGAQRWCCTVGAQAYPGPCPGHGEQEPVAAPLPAVPDGSGEHAAAEASGVLWMAMRYALGRATYAVQEVGSAIAQHAHRLASWQRERMAQEIERELGYDADGVAWGSDAATWRQAISDLRAGLPAVPDGEDATCSCCNGDPLTVCAACEQHSCWAGRFMCDESRTAGTKQASPSPNREDDDRPVRWAWAAWLAESAEQADDLDDSERHGLRIAATHLLEDDIAARLNPGDFDPVADPAWALRFTARLWADVEAGRAARRASAPPDGKDVPARLDAAADALAETSGWQYPSNEVRRVAGVLRNVSPTARAAVAAALALPTEPEK